MKERSGDNSENPANILNFLQEIITAENNIKHFVFDEDASVMVSLGRAEAMSSNSVVALVIEKNRIKPDDSSCFKREEVRELAANFLGVNEKEENRYTIEGYIKSPIDNSRMFCTSALLDTAIDLREGPGGYLLTERHLVEPVSIIEIYSFNLNESTFSYRMEAKLEISLKDESEKFKIYLYSGKDSYRNEDIEDMGSKNSRKLFRALDIIVNNSKRVDPFTGEKFPIGDAGIDR